MKSGMLTKVGSGDHKASQWANAVDKNGSYYVWIPRFAYKITPASDGASAGTIDVKFIKDKTAVAGDGTTCTIATSNIDSTNGYVVHPAFCTDVNMGGYGKELSGIWVAKYEASQEENGAHVQTDYQATGDVAGNDTIKAVSKPDVTSWHYITIQKCMRNAFDSNRGMDSHLMKNSEWGAAAYLTHSQYGRNGNEISINNSDGCYTGRSAGEPGNSATSMTEEGTHRYNTEKGVLASTTGNITGIYDLSGGAWEYVAAFNTIDNHGFLNNGGLTTSSASTPYVTKYTSNTYYASIDNSILGDAVYEVNKNPGSGKASWFSDYGQCVNNSYPFFIRGGGRDSCAGVFSSGYASGRAIEYSFRICLPGL